MKKFVLFVIGELYNAILNQTTLRICKIPNLSQIFAYDEHYSI